MKKTPLILFMFLGLGSCFSSAQGQQDIGPFDRYLAGLKMKQPEAELVRFAGECGVDLKAVAPRFAQSPNQKWIPVKDLSSALKDQETDFYATVSVWHIGDTVLLEEWGMKLDTGSFSRQLVCLKGSKISFFEGVDWTIPVEGESSSNPSWDYQQFWRAGQNGAYTKMWSISMSAQ